MTPRGYVRVALYCEGVRRDLSIHRLVAFAFIGDPPEGLEQVNHRDGVKVNNSADNLEWCDGLANARHASRAGLLSSQGGESNGRAKLTVEQVAKIRASHRTERAMAKDFGVSRSLIGQIRRGEVW